MDNVLVLSAILSFSLSFLFALGGVGAAVALIPALSLFVSLPMLVIKPIALLVNTLSMSGASINNLINGRLVWREGFPLIISSMIFAPVGAYLSQFIAERILMISFIVFLLLSILIMTFFKKENHGQKKTFSKSYLSGVGIFAGLLAGLLGIGGGSIMMPLLVFKGYDVKKVAVLTAFVVPFSSFSAFLTYLGLVQLDLVLLFSCAGAAFIGGALGTAIMHKYTNPKVVKKFLIFILILLSIKMISKYLGLS